MGGVYDADPTQSCRPVRRPLTLESVDKVLMLISADWFGSHWDIFNLDPRNSNAEHIKIASRIKVVGIIGADDNYWNGDFGIERLKNTYADLLELFSGVSYDLSEFRYMIDCVCGISKYSKQIHCIGEILNRPAFFKRMKISNQKTAEDINYPELLISISSDIVIEWPNFERLCLDSITPWDVRLGSFTPGLPSYLSDFLDIEILKIVRARMVFKLARNVMSDNEINSLIWWLDTAYETIIA